MHRSTMAILGDGLISLLEWMKNLVLNQRPLIMKDVQMDMHGNKNWKVSLQRSFINNKVLLVWIPLSKNWFLLSCHLDWYQGIFTRSIFLRFQCHETKFLETRRMWRLIVKRLRNDEMRLSIGQTKFFRSPISQIGKVTEKDRELL